MLLYRTDETLINLYWVDGSASTYRSYKSGEPDKDDDICFVINCDSTEEMEDHKCDNDNGYICKMAAGKIILFYDQVLRSYISTMTHNCHKHICI